LTAQILGAILHTTTRGAFELRCAFFQRFTTSFQAKTDWIELSERLDSSTAAGWTTLLKRFLAFPQLYVSMTVQKVSCLYLQASDVVMIEMQIRKSPRQLQ